MKGWTFKQGKKQKEEGVEMGTPAIGVTGSIGTGKSTFCQYLAEEGGEHLDADTIAKNLMRPGHRGYQPVIQEFGTFITDEQGHIQPGILAKEVFSDPEKLESLEQILHPLVIEEIQDKMNRARKNYYVIDAPLLFEAGVDELCDWVVVVTAPEETVAERLKVRGMSPEQIDQRRRRQIPEEEKIKRADQVVENDGDRQDLKEKAYELRERVRAREFS